MGHALSPQPDRAFAQGHRAILLCCFKLNEIAIKVMKVMTPAGEWVATEDFDASASIESLIDFLIEEMSLSRGDMFEMIDSNGKVVPLKTPVGDVCDSYLELVATGFSV